MSEQQPARPHPSGQITPQLVLGLIAIAVGVAMTLDNLGLLESGRYLRFWPLGMMALGAVQLWQAREGRGGAFGGLVLTTIGTWLLIEKTTFVRLSFWDMWPTLLVVFGAFLVWQGLTGSRARVATAAPADNAIVTAIAILGSVVRGNNSPAFRGGDLSAILGGCELDLRQAAIDGEATIEVFALWGGIEIRVPDDWSIDSRVTPILGGVEDKTRPPRSVSRHRLILRGFIVMAGVEIKN